MLGLIQIAFQLSSLAESKFSPIDNCRDRIKLICIKNSDLEYEKIIKSNKIRINLKKKYWSNYSYYIQIPLSCKIENSSSYKHHIDKNGLIVIASISSKCKITVGYKLEKILELNDIITSLYTEIRFCVNAQCDKSSLSEFVFPNDMKSDIIGKINLSM